MKLCVGAVSRRVIEVASTVCVDQIVASRRQVDIGGGYTGLDQEGLVRLVHDRSGGATEVVRDHGGPAQNGDPMDRGMASFDADVDAGFNSLHVDVCKIHPDNQDEWLEEVLGRYEDAPVTFEIGGERDDTKRLDALIKTALHTLPVNRFAYAVIDLGGHIRMDRQIGNIATPRAIAERATRYRQHGLATKAHNMDWFGDRGRYTGVLDAVNIAPEFGNVEIDAWLRAMWPKDVDAMLEIGYASMAWSRWFEESEGTVFERARAGLRYMMDTPEVKDILTRYVHADDQVRGEIADAIRAARC